MAIRNRFVICLFLLIILQPLFAQDEFSYHALSPGFFIDTENNVPRFIQRFVWHGGEYAHEYEVVIERESNGTFMHHLRDFADSNFINVSLPPGEYRIQIIPYDVFERAGTPSDWMYFEILHALTPYPLMVFSEIITD
ncbi:MAG: hypothetical protein FWC97_09580, partial [Treponema sp.]|nr:hypothetical protein [Treponema sp.]